MVRSQIKNDKQARLAEAFARVAKEVNNGSFGEITLKMEAGNIVRVVVTVSEKIKIPKSA